MIVETGDKNFFQVEHDIMGLSPGMSCSHGVEKQRGDKDFFSGNHFNILSVD